MKRGNLSLGYTLVEVMIVLAVTGVLFTSAVVMVQGQTSKTQFSQSINDLDTQIRDTINDVGAGTFPDVGGYSCSAGPSGLTFSTTSSPQGTNTDCTFMGKVIQFGVHSGKCSPGSLTECDRFDTYTIAGRRVKIDQKLQHASPTVLDASGAIFKDTTQYGLSVTKIYSGATADYSSVGFFITADQTSGAADVVTGSHSVDMVLIPSLPLGTADNATGAIGKINALSSQTDAVIASVTNPPAGVVVCVQGAGGKKGAIIIGATNRQLTTQVLIDKAPTGAGGCP
jgi:prepilin-type N-terminal cleavage/methylation domain-containing protein